MMTKVKRNLPFTSGLGLHSLETKLALNKQKIVEVLQKTGEEVRKPILER